MLKRNSDESPEEKKPFWDHLEGLRKTLFKILVVISGSTMLSFIFAPHILHALKIPLRMALTSLGQSHAEKEILRSLWPAGAFTLSLKISLFSGMAVALPFCLFFIAQFILPGLTQREKKYLLPGCAWGTILFILGGLLCYWIVLPQSLSFFWRYNERMGIIPLWTIENYTSFATFFILAFGLAFETPLLILILMKFNILTPQKLRKKRKHAIVIIFILAAILTPPDVFSQILLAIPMILLYELCIWIGFWAKKE